MSLNDLKKLQTRHPVQAGLAYLGEGTIFRGRDLHNDLNRLTWFELNLFGITGREFSPVEIKILNYICLSSSYPDLRIWPNRIAALAASARATPLMALVGGLSSCDADLFVAGPLVGCLSMYRTVKAKLEQGTSLEALLENKIRNGERIFGFGRPISSIDERVPHFVRFLNSLNADGGYHFRLAFRIEAHLRERKNIRMNIAALYAAVCADLGFNEEEMNLFSALVVFAGMPPCIRDALKKPPGSVLPVRCTDVKYTGPAVRKWTAG